MVHQLALYKLRPDVGDDKLEEMIRRSRSLLLRVPEALAVRSGRRIDPDAEWAFFVGVDFETRAKQRVFLDDPVYLKFLEEVIKPNTTKSLRADYELDPGKNVKYS